jgi:hypothetical protein
MLLAAVRDDRQRSECGGQGLQGRTRVLGRCVAEDLDDMVGSDVEVCVVLAAAVAALPIPKIVRASRSDPPSTTSASSKPCRSHDLW